MTYAEKLKDPRWQKKRLEVLQADNFTCSWCGDPVKTLHVHHFCYPKSRNPWDSEMTDLAALCSDCHYINHYKKFTKLEHDLVENLQIMLALSDKKLLQYFNEIIIRHIKNG